MQHISSAFGNYFVYALYILLKAICKQIYISAGAFYIFFNTGKLPLKAILKYASDVAHSCPKPMLIKQAVNDIENTCEKLSDLRKQGKVRLG